MTPSELKRAKDLSARIAGYPRTGKTQFNQVKIVKPLRGIDYLTPSELESIKQDMQSSVKVPEAAPAPALPEIDAEFVKKIIQIMHTLPEMDKLEVSKGIRNAQSFIYNGTKYQTSEMMHGGGVNTSTGGTVYYIPGGVVDSSNTVFTVTAHPTSVVMDGVTYFENAGYTYITGVITMGLAPSTFIRYTL